jgi:hypothetical protein
MDQTGLQDTRQNAEHKQHDAKIAVLLGLSLIHSRISICDHCPFFIRRSFNAGYLAAL